ncbi:MAG: glycogen/starch/alpha-glucan phosphorylase [Clostridia bacterium]|nr:glycogen/starch/alpha-glucan phosphorylase [Clostridia bacterium]
MNKDEIKVSIKEHLMRNYGKNIEEATKENIYNAAALSLRDAIMEKWAEYKRTQKKEKKKELFYLSFEFLMGKALKNNLLNIGLLNEYKAALRELGFSIDEIASEENDAGLGNGGLGRLAACFMDSLTTLNLPAFGCSIRYEYGLFRQKIVGGEQVETPDNWLSEGHVWEIAKRDEKVVVRFGGNVETVMTESGMKVNYNSTTNVVGIPYDMPILGYDSKIVNTLRLWSARAEKELDMNKFSQGEYLKAVEDKALSEVLSKVLYPEDNHQEGKALRLKQQYFLCSCTMQWIVNRFKKMHGDNLKNLPEYISIHINDTHPALAIPELMRILMDEEGLGWDEAFNVVEKVFAYTNHTIMAEALEKWHIDMIKSVIPRIFMIIEELNRRLTQKLIGIYGEDWGKINYMAIVTQNYVNMANLCLSSCRKINGVSTLHTDILKSRVFADYNNLCPEKFVSITNGITFRRWMCLSNPELSKLITEKIGEGWIKNSTELLKLEEFSCDKEFLEEFRKIKLKKKRLLAEYIKEHNNIEIDPESIFDVQVKRLHEYKRQLLKVLHILYLYDKIKNSSYDMENCTFIFGAKASPGYKRAKLIIRLICDVARLINNDKSINGKIKVVFIENYGVSLAEKIIPASDISEQISTAGKEASGTGNMKFMANGAVTLGTLDGANVEMHSLVGDDNIYIFGMNSAQAENEIRYNENPAGKIYASDSEIRKIIDMLIDGTINPENPKLYYDLYHSLIFGDKADEYMVVRDFKSYVSVFNRAMEDFRNKEKWAEKAVINISKSGYFSSDRTIQEYNEIIWNLKDYN